MRCAAVVVTAMLLVSRVFGGDEEYNLETEAALKFKHYDYKFVGDTGGHRGRHGGAILPDSLRWLWRAADAKTSAQ